MATLEKIGLPPSHFMVFVRQDVVINNVTEFDAERPRLIALATRLLGSGADADDVLQEAWLRFSRAHDIDVLPAWLTTVVTRLCLDHLRRQRVQSAAARAPSLDPITGDPQSDSLLAEQVGEAMKMVVDALAPAERVAFIMHDVFAFSFDEIGAAMGRSSNAVRQLASRARRKFRDQPEPDEVRAADADSRRVVNAFLAAARGGDLDVLLSLLAPDAVMRPDAVARTMGTCLLYTSPSPRD